jgi:hypothetical protein
MEDSRPPCCIGQSGMPAVVHHRLTLASAGGPRPCCKRHSGFNSGINPGSKSGLGSSARSGLGPSSQLGLFSGSQFDLAPRPARGAWPDPAAAVAALLCSPDLSRAGQPDQLGSAVLARVRGAEGGGGARGACRVTRERVSARCASPRHAEEGARSLGSRT